jgi:hypothetical protein
MAAMAIAALSASAAATVQPAPLRNAWRGTNFRPTPPKTDTALDREIAAWNEAVDAAKAEKKAAKRARRLGVA